MFGALIASGIYVILVAGVFSKIARFFPPIVTGSVITVIGLSLVSVAMGNMGNNAEAPTAQSMMLSLLTILIILLIQKFTKGFINLFLSSLVLSAVPLSVAFMGLVDPSPVAKRLGFMFLHLSILGLRNLS